MLIELVVGVNVVRRRWRAEVVEPQKENADLVAQLCVAFGQGDGLGFEILRVPLFLLQAFHSRFAVLQHTLLTALCLREVRVGSLSPALSLADGRLDGEWLL